MGLLPDYPRLCLTRHMGLLPEYPRLYPTRHMGLLPDYPRLCLTRHGITPRLSSPLSNQTWDYSPIILAFV